MGGYPPHPGMEGQMDHGKSKRARTSFKHHQLRIMRSHFQINQNPDSRELKMLSQKNWTGQKKFYRYGFKTHVQNIEEESPSLELVEAVKIMFLQVQLDWETHLLIIRISSNDA